ncbi:unnamed protein product [Pleuronectes platessa]|uniref:Uncharacterized protein n=1 Tax=Pleuronectes platessa TaxID=8262 RepID=A0A9N7YGX3_PLEPL|nr:unnamed protein product [Pleuronectes platessa]
MRLVRDTTRQQSQVFAGEPRLSTEAEDRGPVRVESERVTEAVFFRLESGGGGVCPVPDGQYNVKLSTKDDVLQVLQEPGRASDMTWKPAKDCGNDPEESRSLLLEHLAVRGGSCRTPRSRGQARSFLSPSPGATPPFVPGTAALLGFPAPIPSSVREHPNYTGSTGWS